MNTVTKDEVMANMKDVVCRTEEVLGKLVTHVSVRMKNGFTLHETTTCVDPENYDEKIGRRICLQRIEEKIWFLLGYALQDRLASESKSEPSGKKQGDAKSDMVSISKQEYETLLKRSAFLKKIEEESKIASKKKLKNLKKIEEAAEKSFLEHIVHPYGFISDALRAGNGKIAVVDLSSLLK